MFETAVSLAILLAQTCVAEISFKKDPTECVLMWEINQRNAELRNRSLRKQTLLYNAYWRSTEQRNRRPWIQHLRGADEPKGWPKRLHWKYHKRLWLRYVKAAKEFLRTIKIRKAICPGALDYGAPREYPEPYMKPVVCLRDSLQWFWAKKTQRELAEEKKGILPKKAVKSKKAISESILTMKKREAANGAVD